MRSVERGVKAGGLKIVLTGAAGQLGQELRPRLARLGELFCVDREPGRVRRADWLSIDLADEGQVEVMLNRSQPDLIINAAAYTAVDQAENETDRAFQVNARAPGRMARWAERNDKALLHYSTDYVFDGQQQRPYREDDLPAPINAYGESKLAGEAAIQASGCRHLILRSSWIYSMHGKNFVLTMLDLARRQPKLRVVADQVGCPTWARNLAEYSLGAIKAGLLRRKRLPLGLYHCCDRDALSWHDFARQVFETGVSLGILERVPELQAITSGEYPQLAKRPHWSVLDTSAAQRDLKLKPAALATSLQQCLQEYGNHE